MAAYSLTFPAQRQISICLCGNETMRMHSSSYEMICAVEEEEQQCFDGVNVDSRKSADRILIWNRITSAQLAMTQRKRRTACFRNSEPKEKLNLTQGWSCAFSLPNGRMFKIATFCFHLTAPLLLEIRHSHHWRL